LEKTDPEMYKLLKAEADLDRQTTALAAKYRQMPAAGRDEIKKELEKLVNKHFDARQNRRQLEIKRLEEGLQRLRDAIAERNKARNEVVNKRVKELLGQADDLGF
jgi:DNA anti-recombination protein RmuC